MCRLSELGLDIVAMNNYRSDVENLLQVLPRSKPHLHYAALGIYLESLKPWLVTVSHEPELREVTLDPEPSKHQQPRDYQNRRENDFNLSTRYSTWHASNQSRYFVLNKFTTSIHSYYRTFPLPTHATLIHTP